ncbi:hypothetical protein MTO96_044209 [Rhipicephalus appendiculatus]
MARQEEIQRLFWHHHLQASATPTSGRYARSQEEVPASATALSCGSEDDEYSDHSRSDSSGGESQEEDGSFEEEELLAIRLLGIAWSNAARLLYDKGGCGGHDYGVRHYSRSYLGRS